MPSTGPLNYTTKIPVTQTIAECQAILAKGGAASVSTHFTAGEPVGLSFSLVTPHGRRDFTLPVNVDGVHQMLLVAAKEGRLPDARNRGAGFFTRPEQAARVAWRVLKDWLEAQLALIEARMATIDEVMLPYLHVQVGGEDKILFEHYREQEQAALEAGAG
jgi:hypothetical protein